MKRLGLIVGVLFALAAPGQAWADPVTLTFSELTTQPVNGLSFMGVTFGFQVGGLSSADARYNAEGPGLLTFIQDASLEGTTTGVLMLDFAAQTPILRFGVALSSLNALAPGISVQLFDASLQPLGVLTLDTSPLLTFSEGQFSYLGAPIRRAVITFNAAGARFAVDNLTFEPVPEPASLVLFGIGLAGLVASRKRRKP